MVQTPAILHEIGTDLNLLSRECSSHVNTRALKLLVANIPTQRSTIIAVYFNQ